MYKTGGPTLKLLKNYLNFFSEIVIILLKLGTESFFNFPGSEVDISGAMRFNSS